MCAQVATSGEYLRGHGRVAVDVTALRRLWQHLPVLGLVVLACVPVCAVLRGSYCLLWLRFVNLNKDIIIIIIIKYDRSACAHRIGYVYRYPNTTVISEYRSSIHAFCNSYVCYLLFFFVEFVARNNLAL